MAARINQLRGVPERMRRAFIRAFGKPRNRCAARRGRLQRVSGIKASKAKGPRLTSEPCSVLVVVVNDCLAAGAVCILFLDHGGPVGRLALLDNSGTMIAIPVTIMGFADRYAGADRANVNTNLIRKGRRRDDADQGDSKDRFPHVSSSEKLLMIGKRRDRRSVPSSIADWIRELFAATQAEKMQNHRRLLNKG